MRKIILGLFIILFCFSIGIAALQEEELSKEEKVKAELDIKIERYLKLLNRARLEKLSKEELIIEILDLKEFIKVDQLVIKLLEELVGMNEEEKDVLEPSRLTDDYEHRFSWLDKYYSDLKKKEQKKEISWDEKYRMYPSTKYWLNSLKDPDERYLERIEEENERLEDLLEDLRSERSSLEWDMMEHRWDLELAKPRPLDYYKAAELGISLAMMDIELGIYPYYPRYPRKTDRTNYEPLLFTLCTDSKGKMDWTKYGWLKLLLKNK